MRRVLAVALLSLAVASGGSKLYLKTRTIETGDAGARAQTKRLVPRVEIAGRQRLLIQFDHPPAQEDLDLLASRGVTVLGYVHENGLMVACDECRGMDDLGLLWASRLEAEDKISPLLRKWTDAETRLVLVEPHRDVDPNESRRILLEAGAELVDGPDLLPGHLLARLDRTQIEAVANREEVAYLFPGLDALATSEPHAACAGARAGPGAALGQYTASVGDGWDGPGREAAALGYVFQNTTSQLPADQVQTEIGRAFGEWARVAQLSFSPAARSNATRTINILFAKQVHDDPYPFDGTGGILAHTFYPAPPNPEPLAGDMHFDDDELWRVGASTDLFSVALHELGHALGLGHSDQPGTVMYPYYARQTALTAGDIAAIQELYAPRTEPTEVPEVPSERPSAPPESPAEPPSSAPLALNVQPPPTAVLSESILLIGSVSGAGSGVEVSWVSDRGHAGTATGGISWTAQVLLEPGVNRITITATDGVRSAYQRVSVERRAAATAPVSIQISYPAATTAFAVNHPSFTLRGSATHPSGVAKLTWSNSRGGSGVASGAANWDTGTIALSAGTNAITLSALANDGSTASKAVQVEYQVSSVRDTTAPTLAISSPAGPTMTTSAESIVLSGTARDNSDVSEVVWFSSTGSSGRATGTEAWTTPPIPLMRGYNSIVVRAFDRAGNMGWRSVGVTRR